MRHLFYAVFLKAVFFVGLVYFLGVGIFMVFPQKIVAIFMGFSLSFVTPVMVHATTGGAVMASATALAGCAAVGRALYNYAELRHIQFKGRTEHVLFGDNEQAARIKLYNWKRTQWSTARAILDNREAVKRELCSAIVNKEIVIFDLNGQVIEQPTWGHVAQAIDLEKKSSKKICSF